MTMAMTEKMIAVICQPMALAHWTAKPETSMMEAKANT